MNTLHRTRTHTALLPRYVTRFNCIGADCEDSCCTGWSISIDKKTFDAYRQVQHPDLAPRLAQYVKREESQATEANYARIELRPGTDECPFIENKLCCIQRDLGEDHLSDICFAYPRYSRNFGGQYEQALTLSCPEAARQALLQPDAFDFVEASIRVREDTVSQVASVHGMPPDLMNEVRIFCLQLMRAEGLELWQRLAVLGVFCESLTSTLAKEGPSAVPALLQGFVAMVEGGLVTEALVNLQPNHQIQAGVFSVLWKSKASRTVSPVQNQVAEAIARGLGADPVTGGVSTAQLVDGYSRGLSRLPPALQAAPHLLEHYILNEMFREFFPFEGAAPYEHYLKIVSRFGLLRLMLAAQCNTEGALPDAAALVQTVQVFCRRFQHDSHFAISVNTLFKNTGWSKLENVYSFLRS